MQAISQVMGSARFAGILNTDMATTQKSRGKKAISAYGTVISPFGATRITVFLLSYMMDDYTAVVNTAPFKKTVPAI